jgi:DNA helicase-2/ATP-dependent DNA helicase PcrA
LREDRLKNLFVSSYLYSLYRMGEGEFEDAEDPFPKGRIPFLTIHQAKGLEFPVVVLANSGKLAGKAQRIEEIVRPYLRGDPEPLERVGEFDTMRMYYVALSRAENLMIIANPAGRGQRLNPAFKPLLEGIKRIPELDVDAVPEAKHNSSNAMRAYSYTADYLSFQECARRYMIFRKYEFASSRTQSMFFGNLVHQTIEDLHNRLIAIREQGGTL